MKKKDLIEKVQQLAFELDMARSDINVLNKKVKQLECNHKHIEFVQSYKVKRCNNCDKILEKYDSDLEFKEAQVEYHRQKANEIELER